jgi:hypothetical protein
MLKFLSSLSKTQNLSAQRSSAYSTFYRYNKPKTESKPLPSRPTNLADAQFPNVIESKEHFKFVERILPNPIVPEPPKHESYPTPSGWVPTNPEIASKLSYFVLRTRFHNFPIYPIEREGGSRKLVKIRYIEGDIWVNFSNIF